MDCIYLVTGLYLPLVYNWRRHGLLSMCIGSYMSVNIDVISSERNVKALQTNLICKLKLWSAAHQSVF